jgi:hypothetical protein
MTSRPIVLNQSALKEYLDCHRLYGWRRMQNLDVPLRNSKLEIGTAAHEGLRILHMPGGTTEKALEVAREKLRERSGPTTSFMDASLGEAEEVLSRTLGGYEKHWADSGQMWKPLSQEVQFTVEVIPGWWGATFGDPDRIDEFTARLEPTGTFLRGRADNLHIFLKALWLVDYKTAGKMDPRDLMKYEMDLQLTAYIYGLSKQLTMESVARGGAPMKVEGAIIDLLVKTATPQYAREQFTRSDEEMAEFEIEFVEYANEIRARRDRIEAGEDWKAVLPKNTQQCFRYGTCFYRDLCLKDTPVRRAAYIARDKDYVDEAQAELDKKWKERKG